MPKIIFLPNNNLCPNGAIIEAKVGETILNVALRNGINIEHACEKSCVCTTCHCIIHRGYESLSEITENEDDALDKAWGLEAKSRLSCQAHIAEEDLVVEIPRYNVNLYMSSD